MAKEKTNIDYDANNDIFYVYKEGSVKGNIKIGNWVLDLNSRGDVIGVEVLDASETLRPFKITKLIMRYCKKAKLIFKRQNETAFIGFSILSKMPQKQLEEKPVMVAMPSMS